MSSGIQVHAPYHFVPLSKWVYMPDWAHLVSHDVPFQDGLCGVIEYTLTNATPLCVGDQQVSQQDESTLVKFARDPLGAPVIPGSSLKGMLRAVMEMACFGKFSQVDEQRFSFRDLSGTGNYYLSQVIGKNKVQAGWIRFNEMLQRWELVLCDYCKLSHEELYQYSGVRIVNASSAVSKYKKMPLTQPLKADISLPKGKKGHRWAECLGRGKTEGNAVFTNERVFNKKRGNANNYEFSYFFFQPELKSPYLDIQQQVSDLFTNHDEEQVNYLKRHAHPKWGIPVFALVKSNSTIDSLGFAQMPRARYKNSTLDLVNKVSPAHQSSLYFDMAELVFGTLRDNGLGLKSRVSFSDATTQDARNNEMYYSDSLILNSPKPTFYPAYIEQTQTNETYCDYNQAQSLSGFKRYVAKRPDSLHLCSNVTENKNRKVASRIELCPVGKQFNGKLVFHNLKPIELGALLWVMQLEPESYHQLGHGKPMGAGAIILQPRLAYCVKNDTEAAIPVDESTLVASFIEHMEQVHPQQWRQSPQLIYLLALAEMTNNDNVNTDYMPLANFHKAKTKENKHAKLAPFNGLNRAEQRGIEKSERAVSLAFGVGRLSGLLQTDDIDTSTGWGKNTRQQRELRIKTEQRDKQKRQEEQARAEKKATLSHHAWLVEELRETLSTLSTKSDCYQYIRDIINHFISQVCKQEREVAKALDQLARDYDFHKKPQKRRQEHREMLAKLLSDYGVE